MALHGHHDKDSAEHQQYEEDINRSSEGETVTSKEIAPKEWTNPPELKQLKQDFEDAKPAHTLQKNKIRKWLDNLHIEGSAVLKIADGHSKVQPMLIRKQAEWRYASLSEPFLATTNLFTIEPVTWEDKEPARQNSLILNHQVNTKIDKVAFIDEYVRNAVNEGTIIVKLGWDFQEKEVDVKVPDVIYDKNETMAELHSELAALLSDNPTGFLDQVPEELRLAHTKSVEEGEPYEATITGHHTEKQIKTIVNKPTLTIRDYRNVMLDPSCGGDFSKAMFVIESFDTSLTQLKQAGKYQNLDRIILENNSPLNDVDHETDTDPNFNFEDDARKRLVAYEYSGFWDVMNDGRVVPFIATWVGLTLIQMIAMPDNGNTLPYVFIATLPVKNSCYGEPDGELLSDNQKIIGALTRGMIDVMARSANGQMGVRKDALDAVNRRKFNKGQDYEYNGSVDPRLAFHMHTFPEIPNSAQFMLQQQNIDAESMTGVQSFAQAGINGSSLGDVATGIRGAIDAAGKRETGILRRLASGMIKVGRKIISMNAELLEDEEIIRITNQEFVAIRRDDLGGNFDLSMDISTLEEDNAKADKLAFLLQTLGPSAEASIVRLILRDIARLMKMPELAHEIADSEPQPDPIQQKIQELEIEKLIAEIDKIKSDTMENISGAMLDDSKADTEESKQRNLDANSDKTDLDFVEQQTGTKQEREKELHGEQARANEDLERTKAGLAREENTITELEKFLANKKSVK